MIDDQVCCAGAGAGGMADSKSEAIADEILGVLMSAYEDDRGVHAETILSCLGALAGYASQIAIREALVDTGKLGLEQAFVEIRTRDNQIYYFGDVLNLMLIETERSVWAVVSRAAREAGGGTMPDIREIASHAAATVGTAQFAALRVPAENLPKESPLVSLRRHWRPLYARIRAHGVDPMLLGWYFSLAAQQVITMARGVLAPGVACRIVMESAVAMSKVSAASLRTEAA